MDSDSVRLALACTRFFSASVERGGFGLPFQFKQELASFYLIAAHDGEIGERAAERGGDINKFALDVALKGVGRVLRAAAEQRGGEHEPDDV